MFIYENGLPVRYDHLASDYTHRVHGCPNPQICADVEEAMLRWFNSLPGQARVRRGKVDSYYYGQEVNLKRLDNE